MEDFKEKFFKNEKLIMIPKKEKYRIAVMDYLITFFEDNKIYTEKEVNAVIKDFFDDFAYIRRYFVDNNYLIRDLEGKGYIKAKN